MQKESGGLAPKQPEFVIASEHYTKVMWMKDSISHFYAFSTGDDAHQTVAVVPDACTDILFCLDEENPQAYIAGTVLKWDTLRLQKSVRYFGVRFFPGAHLPFHTIKMAETIGNTIDLDEVCDCGEIKRALVQSRDIQQQIPAFLEFWNRTFPQADVSCDTKETLYRYMTREMIASGGNITIKSMAEASGYSVRYLTQCFHELAGIPPKHFMRMVRFQFLLGQMTEHIGTGEVSLAELAYEAGYCDQSHMMKEFSAYAGTAPGKYMKHLLQEGYPERLIIL